MAWTKTQLGEFAPFVYGKGLPKEKRINGEVPVYGSNGIVGFHNQALLNKPVVVIGRKGSVGEVHLTSGPSWPIDTAFYAESSDKVDLDFLFYLLQTVPLKTNSDSAVPGLSREYAHSLKISVPDKSMQSSIASVLKAIDLKISANNTTSKILEEIAQTIFMSWFIDCDPVKAKMAGKRPVGMDDATAALFPNVMEKSEFGLIPKGWRWGSVGDIASVIDCLHSKKPELLSDGRPYLQLDTIHDDGILRFEKAAQISDVDYEMWTARIEVNDGDCLITNVGRVGAVSQVPSHFKGAIGRNITAIRPIDSERYKTFLAVALTSTFIKKEIRFNTDSGTILEALNVRSIPNLRIPIVDIRLFEAFERLCGPMQAQRQNLHGENVKLMETRDALLPRLISGELQIPEEMLVS
jgi:type I restriction enzyme S subunit